MEDKKRTRLHAELHLTKVELSFIQSQCVLVRPMTHGLMLLLNFEEILEFIKLSEVTPDSYKRMELDEASKMWNQWRCPSKKANPDISIAEIFDRCDFNKKDHNFLGWCKKNKIAPIIRPGDFYWNSSFRGESKELIYDKISQSMLLRTLLLNNYETVS